MCLTLPTICCCCRSMRTFSLSHSPKTVCGIWFSMYSLCFIGIASVFVAVSFLWHNLVGGHKKIPSLSFSVSVFFYLGGDGV